MLGRSERGGRKQPSLRPCLIAAYHSVTANLVQGSAMEEYIFSLYFETSRRVRASLGPCTSCGETGLYKQGGSRKLELRVWCDPIIAVADETDQINTGEEEKKGEYTMQALYFCLLMITSRLARAITRFSVRWYSFTQF